MSKAIKRTAADSTDAETTRVIRTGASRVDADVNPTEVIKPSDSADSERTSVIEPEQVAEPAPKRTTDKVMASLGLFLFRLIVGGILGVHGFQHLAQRDLTLRAVQALPLPSGYAQSGVWVLGICECIAAVCIILGLFTRVAGAGIIAIMVLSLTFIFWGSFAIFKTMGFKGELELLLAACGVLLLFLGAGGWSIDAAYRRSRAAAKAEEVGD